MVHNTQKDCSGGQHGVNCSCPHPLMGLGVTVLLLAVIGICYMVFS